MNPEYEIDRRQTGIDTISLLLGEMKADMKEGARQREEIFKGIARIEQCLSAQRTLLATVEQKLNQLSVDHNELKKQVHDEVEPVLTDYKKLKAQTMAIIAILSSAGGILGSYVGKMFGAH